MSDELSAHTIFTLEMLVDEAANQALRRLCSASRTGRSARGERRAARRREKALPDTARASGAAQQR